MLHSNKCLTKLHESGLVRKIVKLFVYYYLQSLILLAKKNITWEKQFECFLIWVVGLSLHFAFGGIDA